MKDLFRFFKENKKSINIRYSEITKRPNIESQHITEIKSSMGDNIKIIKKKFQKNS